MRIQMVKDDLKLNIYDDFSIGVMQNTEGVEEEFLNLTFGENDREEIHVFKIHKDKIDDFINMVRENSGKKIQIAKEMPHGIDVREHPAQTPRGAR